MLSPAALVVFFGLAVSAAAEPITLPPERRPPWLRDEGIVMAGSWEPLLFRIRRDGAEGYTPTPEQREAYRREQSPEMVAQLKSLGVNFVMMHCYKGGGLEAEQESMADAVRFARLCHDAGLRVGVYHYSGAFIWELFFKELPQAKDWVVHNPDGSPKTYGKAAYRYYWNRNHPDAQAFYRKVIRFAVEEIRADLIHFDNYGVGPGHDANSVQRFRQYLRGTFTPELLAAQGIDPGAALPPTAGPKDLLGRAWADFCCQSLADSYHDMGRYARTRRKVVLGECNPAGVRPTINPPVEHGRLLGGGEAIWDESGRSGYAGGGRLTARIRTCKFARRVGNTVFAYSTTPLEAAEAMAFNLDCLGAICWFEYGRIVERPGKTEPMSNELLPYVRFFHKRRDLLRDARVVADVAVVRSFPSMVFGEKGVAGLAPMVEDALIFHRRPFTILYEPQLDLLPEHKVAVLAGCAALGDPQIEQIRRYVAGGGRVCAIGPLATHDLWMRPRPRPALDTLPADQVVRIDPKDNPLAAIDRAFGGPPTLVVTAKAGKPEVLKAALPYELPEAAGLCAELTEQPGRRMVHLVNYRGDGPVRDISVRLRLPKGRAARSVVLAAPERPADLKLPFTVEGDVVAFTVPEVGVYQIAVVAME